MKSIELDAGHKKRWQDCLLLPIVVVTESELAQRSRMPPRTESSSACVKPQGENEPESSSQPVSTSPSSETQEPTGDLRRSVLAVLDQAVVSATNLATIVLLGRLCPPRVVGAYYLTISLLLLSRCFQEALIFAPFTVYSQRQQEHELAAYTGSTLVHQLGLSLMTIAAVAGFPELVRLLGGSVELRSALVGVAIAIPFIQLREWVRYIALSRLWALQTLIVDSIVAVVQCAGLLLLVWGDQLTVSSVYIVIAVATAIAIAAWMAWGGLQIRLAPERFLSDWLLNWRFSRWVLAGRLAGSATPYALPWLLASWHGTAATGVLAVCGSIVGLSNTFVVGLSNIFCPRAARAFAHGGTQSLRRILRNNSLVFAIPLGGFCILVALLGEPIMDLIYGPRYGDQNLLLALLAASVLINGIGMVIGHGIWAIDRPAANLWADLGSLVATMAAALALIPTLAAAGVAIAGCIGVLVGTLIRAFTLQRLMHHVPDHQQAS